MSCDLFVTLVKQAMCKVCWHALGVGKALEMPVIVETGPLSFMWVLVLLLSAVVINGALY